MNEIDSAIAIPTMYADCSFCVSRLLIAASISEFRTTNDATSIDTAITPITMMAIGSSPRMGFLRSTYSSCGLVVYPKTAKMNCEKNSPPQTTNIDRISLLIFGFSAISLSLSVGCVKFLLKPLPLVKVSVFAVKSEKFFVSTAFDDAAVFEDADLIGVLYRRDAMRDNERRPALANVA